MTNRPIPGERRAQAILGLLRENGQVRAADVVGRLGVSRQTAHLDLLGLVNAGLIERRGAGRGSHYVSPGAQLLEYAIDGLHEERVWTDVRAITAARGLSEIALSLAHYSVTEMVNNVIDHSASVNARIRAGSNPPGGLLTSACRSWRFTASLVRRDDVMVARNPLVACAW